MDIYEKMSRRINELRTKYRDTGKAEYRYRLNECERLGKLLAGADTGRTTQVVALHAPRPKAIPKGEESRDT